MPGRVGAYALHHVVKEHEIARGSLPVVNHAVVSQQTRKFARVRLKIRFILYKHYPSYYAHNVENELLCQNPTLCISYEDCAWACNRSPDYVGKNVFTDDVPDNHNNQSWMSNSRGSNGNPQILRIGLSCPMMISSVKMRNRNYSKNQHTKDFEIKVRQPNSSQWIAYTNGTLSNPQGQSQAPLETFNATAVIAKEVEFTCLTVYPSGSNKCGLNYIGFA